MTAARSAPFRRIVILLLALLSLSGAAYAQAKTDVVRLGNGDAITGEVSKLDRGRLEYTTDDVGTIYIEWDKVVSVTAKGQFDVIATNGHRFLGSLAEGTPRSIVVVGASGTTLLPTEDVTTILPIGSTLWKRLDGSFDVGFSLKYGSTRRARSHRMKRTASATTGALSRPHTSGIEASGCSSRGVRA